MSNTAEVVRKMSASRLAAGTGLGGQELHWLMQRAGMLGGQPGGWRATENAMPYVAEEYRQRGTGGYGFYNPSWDWLTWDPAVLDELDLSEDGKQWARQAVKEWRLAQKAARVAETAAADAAFLRTQAAKSTAGAAHYVGSASRTRVILGLGVATITAYGLYKGARLVRQRWQQRTDAPQSDRNRDDREAPPEA